MFNVFDIIVNSAEGLPIGNCLPVCNVFDNIVNSAEGLSGNCLPVRDMFDNACCCVSELRWMNESCMLILLCMHYNYCSRGQ